MNAAREVDRERWVRAGAVPDVGLVGRTADVDRLRRLVADVAGGRGRSVWVEGEPGVGKSALLAVALDMAKEAGAACGIRCIRRRLWRARLWDLIRAAARLRPYGIRPGVRGPRRRPSTGWDALTPTELRVAKLVAAGQSNPDIADELFLSRRTVQTHVSHILSKIEAHSRIEIARRASDGAHATRAAQPRPPRSSSR